MGFVVCEDKASRWVIRLLGGWRKKGSCKGSMAVYFACKHLNPKP